MHCFMSLLFFFLLCKLGLGMPPVSRFNLCPYMALVFGFENDLIHGIGLVTIF